MSRPSFVVILRQLVAPAGVAESRLPERAARRLGCDVADILSCRVLRRSLDARKRRARPVYVYHLRLELAGKVRWQIRKLHDPEIIFEPSEPRPGASLSDPAPAAGRARPVVVGGGPAGLFAALRLARAGARPILLEQGDGVDARTARVADFWRQGALDPESNVFHGLGGAGLFSDGKLNTRHKDRAGLLAILRILVEAGAPESILVDAAPHVGTDLLAGVVSALAREITALGGEIRLRSKLTGIRLEGGRLRGLIVAAPEGEEETGEEIAADLCVLATGHSARGVYEMLRLSGVELAAKPFAIGVRAEMPQEQIDASQRSGTFCPRPGEAAAFRLSRAPAGLAAACYTFCMCPGGTVIACASEPGRLAVNGMSRHARAGEWGNAAFLTPVGESDFAAFTDVPAALRGIEFQRRVEEAAYRAGLAAGEYAVPASSLSSFAAGATGTLPERRGVARAAAADLRLILPDAVARTLADAVPAMLSRLRRVNLDDVVLYAAETRTSSPVRILRGETGEAAGAAGLFPAGEGAGYAGGIMTSALDGWTAAGRALALTRARRPCLPAPPAGAKKNIQKIKK